MQDPAKIKFVSLSSTLEDGAAPETQSPEPHRPTVGFVSLGCPKNLVDSEVMMGLLHRGGAQLTPRAEDADILVVNTCSFIDSAKQESVDTILEMVRMKTIANGGAGEGKAQRLIVAGCLVERYRDEIRANIPEVDAVVGTGELEAILEAAGLNRPTTTSPFAILTTAQIDRHASSVNQHSRPEADSAQIIHETTSRAEGDAREAAGRFSRDSWDGATAALPTYLYSDETPRILTTPKSSAYIKIAEGCDHPCSFCIIPQLRGKFRSRPLASIVAEAKSLIAQGVREITLIGQDTTCYGEDLLPSIPKHPGAPFMAQSHRDIAGVEGAETTTGPSHLAPIALPGVEGGFSPLSARENNGASAPGLSPSEPWALDPDPSLLRRPELADLLDALAPLPGLKWLRFLYAYPNKITPRLLQTIARHDTIANYLDVPLQHASANVLRRMKRGGTSARFLQIIANARKTIPNLVLRTSFIVGFPGETEADFNELCAFVEAAQIDWLGVFSYSDEEGAGAFSLDEKVPRRTIEARRRKLMRLQQKISRKARKQWIGRELDILVEGESEETDLLWQGRTLDQAPEIDGKVLINDFGPHDQLVPGTFYRAQITESHDYDVVARILD
jgi:ribosomal protein S12 methylthiotransferase